MPSQPVAFPVAFLAKICLHPKSTKKQNCDLHQCESRVPPHQSRIESRSKDGDVPYRFLVRDPSRPQDCAEIGSVKQRALSKIPGIRRSPSAQVVHYLRSGFDCCEGLSGAQRQNFLTTIYLVYVLDTTERKFREKSTIFFRWPVVIPSPLFGPSPKHKTFPLYHYQPQPP